MKKLRMLLRKLVCTGAILPGSINRQFNVCGMPGCRCKDKENPRRHGPYFQLSYGAKGKSSSMFVKEADAAMAGEMTESYRRIRDLTVDIGHEMVALCREKGFGEAVRICNEILDREKRRSVGMEERKAKPEKGSGGKTIWKERASERMATIERKRIESRDLRASRDKWREESLALRKELEGQGKRLKHLERENIRLSIELKKKRL